MAPALGVTYINCDTGHRLTVTRVDFPRLNARTEARNHSTGQTETWSTHLFLAEHRREGDPS